MGIYSEKVNATPKQKKIKAALEAIGQTNVEVWWEPVGISMEMCGPDGGYSFHSDQEELWPLGYSFNEAMECIQSSPFLKVKSDA